MQKMENKNIKSTITKVAITMIMIIIAAFTESYYLNDPISRIIGFFSILEFIAGIILFKGLRSLKE